MPHKSYKLKWIIGSKNQILPEREKRIKLRDLALNASRSIAFDKEDLLLGETKHNQPLYFTGYIKEMPIHRVQIDPGSSLNLISTSALEELSIPPSKPSHTSVSIFGYDGSTQKPIGKIRFKL